MKYLVTARLKPRKWRLLLEAIKDRTLGEGSIAGDEYLRNMEQARLLPNGRLRWVEVCFCPSPLQEEQPYWEEFFELERVQNAHDRGRCRDLNGEEPWACTSCDCTDRLDQKLRGQGQHFFEQLSALGDADTS